MIDPGVRRAQRLIIGKFSPVVRVEAAGTVSHHAGRLLDAHVGGERAEKVRLRHQRRRNEIMQRKAKGNLVDVEAGKRDDTVRERILRLHAHQFLHNAFAHTGSGDCHAVKLADDQDFLERDRRDVQQLRALAVQRLDLRPRGRVGQRVHRQPGGAGHLPFVDLIALQDVQRIAVNLHDEAREGPPGAADRIEPPLSCRQRGAGLQLILNPFAQLLRIAHDIAERQRSDHQAFALRRRAADGLQLQAGAAEVSAQADGTVQVDFHAARRQLRLVLAGQEAHGAAEDLAGLFEKVAAIIRGAHRCRFDSLPGFDVQRLEDRPETPQRSECSDDALGGKVPGPGQPLSEACHDLFVEALQDRRAQDIADHAANGVRPDIDDTGLPGLGNAHFCPSGSVRRGGRLTSSALPRPERLGLDMKYP